METHATVGLRVYNPSAMNRDVIYLDNNASTRPLPKVVEAMLPFLKEQYANPSSVHGFGQFVRHQVECARAQVASLMGASPREIIFTSCGTESINLALRGALGIHPSRKHVVVTAVAHPAVLRVAEALQQEGYTVDRVGVDREGRLDEAEWEEKLSDHTAVASIIHANNETGVLFDVHRLARIAHDCGAVVHVDAVQSAGKIPIDVSSWPAHLVSLSAHKFHGPKGVGALYVRKRTRLGPLIHGGMQERELRGGTENVAGIIGMGVAAEAAQNSAAGVSETVGGLRDLLEAGIKRAIPFARVNAAKVPRVHNTTNISFARLGAEAILILLSEAGICASSGAACSSGSLEASHVLEAMGVEEHLAHGAIRFSLSQFNTREEIDHVVATLPNLLSRLTALGRF